MKINDIEKLFISPGGEVVFSIGQGSSRVLFGTNQEIIIRDNGVYLEATIRMCKTPFEDRGLKSYTMEIFPKANEDEKSKGWAYSVQFLKSIQIAANDQGVTPDLEDVDAILISIRAYIANYIIDKYGIDGELKINTDSK